MNALDLEKNQDLLVIGYDVAHPTAASGKDMANLKKITESKKITGLKKITESKKMTESKSDGHNDVMLFHPSVVGISANKNRHLCSFSADFSYQESRREEVCGRRLEKAVQEIIERSYHSSKDKRKPTRLFTIRDGVSEGQYKMVKDNELNAILAGYAAGMKSIGDETLAKNPPKVTFMIATKRHNKRFFRFEHGKIQNTRPGDFVDEKVVHTGVVKEFFLQTHHALKGTAQLTQYSVLLNELKIPMLDIQEFMLMLSFMHQVSACPTSLPLPVYLADETAKRGQQIYNEWNKLDTKNPERHSGAVGKEISDYLRERFDELTAELHYGNSKLVGTRYNS